MSEAMNETAAESGRFPNRNRMGSVRNEQVKRVRGGLHWRRRKRQLEWGESKRGWSKWSDPNLSLLFGTSPCLWELWGITSNRSSSWRIYWWLNETIAGGWIWILRWARNNIYIYRDSHQVQNYKKGELHFHPVEVLNSIIQPNRGGNIILPKIIKGGTMNRWVGRGMMNWWVRFFHRGP